MKTWLTGFLLILFVSSGLFAQESNRTYTIQVLDNNTHLTERNKNLALDQESSGGADTKYLLERQSDGFWRITGVASNRHWHVDISKDRLLATKFQPNDDHTRFALEQQQDGSYFVKLKATNGYLQLNETGSRLGVFRDQSVEKRARILFQKELNANERLGQINSGGLYGYISMNINRPAVGFGYGISWYTNVWSLLEKPINNYQIGLPSTWIHPDNEGVTTDLCPVGTFGRDQADKEDQAVALYNVLQAKKMKTATRAQMQSLMPNFSSAQLDGGIEILRNRGIVRTGSSDSLFITLNTDLNRIKDWTNRRPFKDLFQTIEGGLGYWNSNRFMTSKPKFRLNAVPNCYKNQVATSLWEFGGQALDCDIMGTVQISNRLLVPPDGITFEEDTESGLLGTAWMALPFTPLEGYYQLQTPEMEKSNSCLTRTNNNGISSEPCGRLNNTAFKIRHKGNGYFELFDGDGKCIEGNSGTSRDKAALMTNCGFTGQAWRLISRGNGYYKLTNQFLENSNRCLEYDMEAGVAMMKPCSNFEPEQLWKLTGVVKDNEIPTGNHAWTLFLNTTNFKGPLVFMHPTLWSDIAKIDPSLAGRGLDARAAIMGGGSMEVNTIPRFEAEDDNGTLYTKIPRMQYPVDNNGEFTLMQDVKYYSSRAVFGPVLEWFNNQSNSDDIFNLEWSRRPSSTPRTLSHTQQISTSGTPAPITDMDNFVSTFRPGTMGSAAYGLKWEQNHGIYPEYFKQEGDRMVAISADQVPEETNLTYQNFRPKTPLSPYTVNQNRDCFDTPTSGSERTVELNDGSRVTYVWYRFVDQPALQHLNMTASQKRRLQSLVEKIHRSWRIDGQYIPSPSSGNLVTIDPSLIISASEARIGFVPIVIRQE